MITDDPLVGATVRANWYDSPPLEVIGLHEERNEVRLKDHVHGGEEAWAGRTEVTVICRDHDWRGVSVAMAGHGSLGTHAVEQCTECKLYRKVDDPEFVNWEPEEVSL